MLSIFHADVLRGVVGFHKRLWSAMSLFALASYSGVSLAQSQPVLVLNDTNEPPYTTIKGDGFLDIVAGEAFRRAGFQLRLLKLPPERGLSNANAGIDDGDLTRIEGLEQHYPNLVRVPEKLIDWHFVAFARSNAQREATWTSLAPLAVGHIKGWKIYERNLLPATSVTLVDDATALFSMLGKNRIDVALYERWLGIALVRKMRIQDANVLNPPLAVKEMFIYLHKRHADKVPAIAAGLRTIKAEGLYRKICREKLAEFDASFSQCEDQ